MNEQEQNQEQTQVQFEEQAQGQLQEQFQDQEFEVTREVSPEEPKMGIVQRLISLFISPTALFQNVKLHPVILIPLIFSVIIGLATVPVNNQYMDIYLRELSHLSLYLHGVDLTGITALEGDVYGDYDMTGFMDTIMNFTLIVTAILGPLFFGAVAAIGLFILSKIFRGRATIGQHFSVVMHAYVVYSLMMLVAMALMVVTGNMLDVTSLAALLMPGGNISMVNFNLLSAINLANIWGTFLVFLGIKIINEFSTVKALIISLIYLGVNIAFYVGAFMLTFASWDMMMGMGAF